MTVLLHLIGTFLMFLGFFALLAGGFLLRMKQEDMGKLFMTTAYMGGGEVPDKAWVRVMASMHGNERLRRLWALGMMVGGLLIALFGASFS
jgi:hypothetical protein